MTTTRDPSRRNLTRGRSPLPPIPSTNSSQKRRGYYSDVATEGVRLTIGDIHRGPKTKHSSVWTVTKEKHTPPVTAFVPPENAPEIIRRQRRGPTTALKIKSEFKPKAWEPKVQMPFKTDPGKTPRKIEIDRQKRVFGEKDVVSLITDRGIDINELMPLNEFAMRSLLNTEKDHGVSTAFPAFLPLEVFDDTEYDSRTLSEWAALMPAPGKALLSVGTGYEWKDVVVVDFNESEKLFRVCCLGDEKEGGESFEVPRIRLLFAAEDPDNFADRVESAFRSRAKTEALLRYNLYVDCMPTDGVQILDQDALKRMKKLAKSTVTLEKSDELDEYLVVLTHEVSLDFFRAMNCITFNHTVNAMPEAFPFVTLPDESEPEHKDTGCFADVPPYPFEAQSNSFIFKSFLTRHEAIMALCEVRAECNKIVGMSLFYSNMTKMLRLDEFEQMQTQSCVQVQTYCTENWLSSLKQSVRFCLRDIGKGWFNMKEKNWEVYLNSKLKMFMELIKFMMQDSLRYLVLNSLASFTQMMLDASCSVMDCKANMEWPGSLLASPFKPKRSPLFLLDLQIDPNGAIQYSTPIENFEAIVIAVFNKGIDVLQNVPQLEGLVMEDLFWTGKPLLEAVGTHEPSVEDQRALVCLAVQQALIPLQAYAKKYEQFLELATMDIPEYLKKFDEEGSETELGENDEEKQGLTAADIKAEIDYHLEEKACLEQSIPSHITIGPFYVSCEAARNSLSSKRKKLAKAVLEMLAKKLRKQADDAIEEFREMSEKLFDKPNSMEDLVEQREFMKTIPDILKKFQEKADKANVDYDLIEEFYYNLSQEDFNARWTMIGWPRKLEGQMEMVHGMLDKDEERFRKNQFNDQNSFEDRLDSLQMAVAGFSAHVDIKKAAEVSVEARRIVKQLKECQQLAQLYNQRERLFGMPVTQYDKVGKLIRDFDPYKNLWLTSADWMRWHESWMKDSLTNIDAELLESNLQNAYKIVHKCVKHFRDIPGCLDVASDVKKQIEAFKPYVPLIQGLRNPGMRNRHWEQLSTELGFQVIPKATLTLAKCLEKKMDEYIDVIGKVAEVAGKEFSIEQALDKMEGEWEPVSMEVMSYKETGTYIVKFGDDCTQLLDDHIVMTQSMSFSPYKKPFEARIQAWEQKLRLTQDVLDELAMCQRSWLYLEPIFSSEDINRQLPVESKRYQTMDRIWRRVMNSAKANPLVIDLCPDQRLLDNLKECNKLLEQVQKGLSEYLETKRAAFPRFYFLSDEELLEILSQTKDPTAVQPHLRKCFENIAKLKFEDDLRISSMASGEGEVVPFSEDLYPRGNVEDWLLEVETVMRRSLKQIISDALEAYKETPRTEWVLGWPGQVVIAGCQTYWTTQVTQAINADSLSTLYDSLLIQLADLVTLVRGDLTKIGRMIMSALIVIEVHARDVVARMVEEGVRSANDFEWISQLRYYWNDELLIRAVNAEFVYGYEYLGNTGRLVITPLTDRCYLTLTGALHLRFGGAPAGPAGTGKTETTKDLAKAVAIQCVVFNCSDQLDYMAMGKFFKGLASAGAWACFDEFNRIYIEVLSVVAQQITTIQKAQQQHLDRFMFEGVEISLRSSCAVFVTMNPGYAGRTELPDNLKALFRPVAMMVPDYAMIAEIMLFSFGFSDAKVQAKKIVTTFKLSSEQLSSQDHYDFGMRAVKTVISAAGNLKREHGSSMSEELIVLRAIRDVNVPKFLQDDLKLFDGIVSDLFPHVEEKATDYGDLEEALRQSSRKCGLQDVNGFLTKCIQLYETTVVRHGLMLVGPTGSGKTSSYKVLSGAMTSLKGQRAMGGGQFEEVHKYVVNPKSITMGQLYGEFDSLTHEWTDGILPTLVRHGVAHGTDDYHWYVFDGPVDAIWIENMNTVLDDNKKLCLTSGEIIKLTEPMRMIFEVQDLAVASPATVSRCGMVYLEPSILGLDPFVYCWLNMLPAAIKPHKETLKSLFEAFLEPSLDFMRAKCKEIIPTVNSNLVFSTFNFLDAFFEPFIPREGEPPISSDKLSAISKLIEPWFLFALVWAVGGTCDGDGRKKFSDFVRHKMANEKIKTAFPADSLVYDYRFDDGGVSNTHVKDDDDDDDGDKKKRKMGWVGWMDSQPEFSVDLTTTRFADVIVPTTDTVRSSAIIELLLVNQKKVLCVGPTGTGKSLTVSDKLLKKMPKEYLSDFLTFSARTSANQTQDIIDSKLDKRRKGVFGPPLGKRYIFFIDDLNMPALEEYGAQPPVELVRQWMDHGGWYDRKAIGQFRKLVDIGFVCAMGPPGGGRNPITLRLTRHFNHLAFVEMEDANKQRIFSSILSGWLDVFPNSASLTSQIVEATISVYSTITSQLLPTPAKSHYTFNLRDLSKVFQGMTMARASRLGDLPGLLRLWHHECCRVIQDRLVNNEDRAWFEDLLKSKFAAFNVDTAAVLTRQPIFYGDFMISGADNKVYSEIEDHAKMVAVCEEYLDDYNQTSTAPMKLVLFLDAVQHITRISRVIRQPLGNSLLLGVGGSGRQSLTRLAAHMAEYDCFQIELAKNYGVAEWREDIKGVMLKAGLEDKPMVFLFSDTQIKSESFLEDINNILNSGDVPNIYGLDELDNIYLSMKPVVQDAGVQPTKANFFSAYTKRVRSNIHVVICMSPIGEVFRARLRQFPSLVNCCTIDWFSEWPDEALKSVASTFLQEITDLDESMSIDGLVLMCVDIHQSVSTTSKRFLDELSRYNYVTPTSYLELLGTFQKLIKLKKTEIGQLRSRTKGGLDKLLSTAEEVSKLQEDLESMRPMLEQAQVETVQTMEKIQKDSVIANETKTKVQKEEVEATKKAEETKAIADDAQRDLDEALPALDAAVTSLKSLNKGDVVEVRGFIRPALGVRLVMEAVAIMKEVKPRKVEKEGGKLGQKVDDYWEPAKALLQDPAKFLESLYKYDKENIPDSVIQKIQPIIDNDDFQPAAIAKVSRACTSICQWVRAMHKYHFVSRGVAPKRARLAAAQASLDETVKLLNEAKARLREVEEGIATLKQKYEECVAKKQDLTEKCDLCSARLGRAEKLIGGLKDEKVRWGESVSSFEGRLKNIVGDVLVSSGFVAYLGPFTGEFRAGLVAEWLAKLTAYGVAHDSQATLVRTLGDPVKIRNWQIAGLPRDTLSIENGVIVQFSRRWPLFIDPQGQANKWVKNMEKDNGLDVVKLTDRDFLRSLENAVRFGKPCLLENVGEELDPALEPILLKQTFKQAGSLVIKLGDSTIPYHDDFKLYITTKLPNPHYTPEVSTKVTLVNFTLSPSGLEDQMLALAVAEERPDLEEAKNQLIVSNARMRQELKEIEDKILDKLSNSEGSPVDDLDLIDTLEKSKAKSGEIKAKVVVAEQTEKDIDTTRSQYIPVAVRTQILFFCVTDLANIDPMYQYSLEWFISIFLGSMANAESSDNVTERIENINDYFTFSLYSNVCRSLFEKHKLLFSFLLCARMLMNENKIDMSEWRHLIAGGTQAAKELPNPSPDWISQRSWSEILTLPSLEKFTTFAEDFVENVAGFKRIFDSNEPHREPLPGALNDHFDDFQKLLVLRSIRADKVTNAMQDFVARHLGQCFIEPQTADLSLAYKDSSATCPLIFVLSVGTDPAADLYKFAEEMKFSKKLTAISLGQGQGPRAEAMMKSAMERGKWVFFQNCHLSPSWMPSLERLIEQIDSDKVHRDFRLWLTSMPSPKFPVSILQNGSKMTVEPPRGIKANLLQSFASFSDDFLSSCAKKNVFKSLLLSLCLFHGVALERRKFGALGFNIPYEFTTGDLRICISQLKMFLDEYHNVPFKVLKYTAGHINYGGRVTDDWDRRCLMNILEGYYNPEVVNPDHVYSESGIYHQLAEEDDHEAYITYIKSLPINDTPEIFSLHANANITFALNETFALLRGLVQLQPKSSGGTGRSIEEVVEETSKSILEKVPEPIAMEPIMKKYPVKYEESMNTVLIQEVIRYNRLLHAIRGTLMDLLKALKGLVVMSQELETMANSLYNNAVPSLWAPKSYPSLKPLASWVTDLVARMDFIQEWIEIGIPSVFWISGFFFPQAFLTGTLQNFARKAVISIDTINFDFRVRSETVAELTSRPENGCYIRGLFIEGARWDPDGGELAESRPKELYTTFPVIHLVPVENRKVPETGMYMCPVYKTLTRAGTLSTTGHSTNYVVSIEIPSSEPQRHWIKRGVALLCALNY
eukprot:m.93002 g.93002  ORF g.93002 m.93002 type:complete len:4173 (+) comp36767_c0_seq9:102-12620(+)